MDADCPFPKKACDLSSRSLSSVERNWIADGINGGRFTAVEVAKKYQIERKLCNKWS